GAEARELGADPFVGPPAPPGVSRLREAVAGRPARSDLDEEAGLDELGEVVGRLRTAGARELLVPGTRQIGRAGARQALQCQPLRRFQLPHEAPLPSRNCLGRYRQISVLPTSSRFVQRI